MRLETGVKCFVEDDDAGTVAITGTPQPPRSDLLSRLRAITL
jgi:hypothetical protein